MTEGWRPPRVRAPCSGRGPHSLLSRCPASQSTVKPRRLYRQPSRATHLSTHVGTSLARSRATGKPRTHTHAPHATQRLRTRKLTDVCSRAYTNVCVCECARAWSSSAFTCSRIRVWAWVCARRTIACGAGAGAGRGGSGGTAGNVWRLQPNASLPEFLRLQKPLKRSCRHSLARRRKGCARCLPRACISINIT